MRDVVLVVVLGLAADGENQPQSDPKGVEEVNRDPCPEGRR